MSHSTIPNSDDHPLHFVLFPLMAQGHMIPMVDIGRLLAQHGIIVTVVTTPRNAARFAAVVDRAVESGLRIQVVVLRFPSEEAGLPDGCENFDMLPSLDMSLALLNGASMLQQPAEKLFEELSPPPRCIISDVCLPWTSDIAIKHGIPRISFAGGCCFCMLCLHNTAISGIFDSVTSESEYFAVPGLPDHIELNKNQMMSPIQNMDEFNIKIGAAETETYGMIINSFEELELAYAREYRKARGDKIWCVGPASSCNKNNIDKAQRGNSASGDTHECSKWLDSQDIGSVLYVCLGSMNNLIFRQLVELGLALEELNRPFIWVMRNGGESTELGKWISSSGFEERVRGRGMVIQGWAPQVFILSHPAVGGFVTHCGWNSTLEAISAGVPMVTWPLFADQFCNEKLVVQVLKVGVSVGVKISQKWGLEEQNGVLVSKEDVIKAVECLMEEGEEKETRKERAKTFSEMALKATEKGGSSYRDMELLIQDIAAKRDRKGDI